MEQGAGERGYGIMKKMINKDEPFGKLTRVKDFLPSPKDLAVPQETVKVTLSLSKMSVAFFKQQARRHHTKYQRMIRQLIDKYTFRYSQAV